MTLNLTRGGLSPAKIINLGSREEVHFMFNPFEYSLAKSNTWEKETAKGKNVPRHNFQSGGAQTLSLTLYFDSLQEKKDIRGYTDTLWKMMMVDEEVKNPRTGKSSPPPVAFEWGRLYFKAIITSMTQKFTLFTADGTPIRCQVDISLEQYVDENEFQAQISGLGPGQEAAETTVLVEGQRLDHVGDHREIAEKNNIDNPNNIPSGTSLST